MTIKRGWTGRVFEDFEVGDVYQHPLGRTVIAADNIWFTLLTQNTNPIHFDAAYSAQTEYGKPLVDSTFTLALVTGQSVADVSQNAMPIWDGTKSAYPIRCLKAIRSILAVKFWKSASLDQGRTWVS